MRFCLTGLGLTMLLTGLLTAQTAQTVDKTATFEVADVHVSAPGTPSTGGFMPGGRLDWRAATMLDLISAAYGMDNEMIVGGPAWLNTDKFDIIANGPPGAVSFPALQAMLKNLLAERFKLVANEEKRDSAVYVLTVGKKGPKLQTAAKEGPAGCETVPGDPAVNIHRACHNFTLATLAEFLPQAARNFVDHTIVDETGLTGSYDLQLDWMGKGVYNQAKANPDGPAAVSVFDAVEKLGLKLEPGRRPLPVVAVASVNETPTPNAPGITVKIPTYPVEFDVAEVRPAKETPKPGTGPIGQMNIENGRLEIMGATLKGLLSLVFDFPENRIFGAPKWMEEDRFDIIAKTQANVPFEAMRVMMKTLLTQRFKLATHNEDQPVLVYVLLAGKKPRLKQSDGAARSECKVVQVAGRPNLACQNTTMAQFAERLPDIASSYIQPPLLDLTELKGAYDFQLYWTAKRLLPGATNRDTAAPAEAVAPGNDITVFEALDKQLGLKAEQQKRPVPVLVVDKADRTPSDR